MPTDMTGRYVPHKLITEDGMKMIVRQLESDCDNAIQVFEMYQNGLVTEAQFKRYTKEYNISRKQQGYALQNGRFR